MWCGTLYLVAVVGAASAFLPSNIFNGSTRRHVFITQRNLFGKIFEEEGMLGPGITVGKVQVALTASDRSADSIFGLLERKAKAAGDRRRARRAEKAARLAAKQG